VALKRDPFFDQPYEPSGEATPAWEAVRTPAATPRAPSPNIRARRKTAALLGGSRG
jgi:hypothetical protein